jgi:hypothetical protein
MSPRRRTTAIATAILIVSMAASVLFLHRIDEIRPKASIDDVLYVNSPNIVKRASLGFNGLMACIYWTRAVQYFGHRHYEHHKSYNQLAPLLEITTALDPHLVPAYEFGASFLAPPPPNGAGEAGRAIELMEYGIRQNPDNWHLYYDLAFVYYTELKDYKRAGDAFERGSHVPGAHPFMKLLAAQMHEHAGDFQTARLLWQATYDSTGQVEVKKNALEHLRCLKVDEDVSSLQAAVTRFEKSAGHPPTTMWELITAEHLPGIPVDPEGNPYTMAVDGRILVQNPDDFPFITEGLPAGYKRSERPKFHDNP